MPAFSLEEVWHAMAYMHVNSSLLGIPPSGLGCVISGPLSDPQRSDGVGWGRGKERRKTTGTNNSLHVVSLIDSFLLTLRRWVVCLIWGAQSCWDIPFRDSPALLMSPCSSCYCDCLGVESAPSQQNPAPYECTVTPPARGSRFHTSGIELNLINLMLTELLNSLNYTDSSYT